MLRTNINSPLRWLGGKGRIVDWILSHFPPHERYLEPFGGGAAVLFAKQPSVSETYNDLDSSLVNFFRVLKDESKCKKLRQTLEYTPYAREIYEEAANKLKSENPCTEFVDDIDWAAALFIGTRQSMSGIVGNTWGRSYVVSQPSANFNAVSQLEEFGKRLRMVQIDNRDAIDLIKLDDHEKLLCYCDPPYIPEARTTDKRSQYIKEVDASYHEKLLEVLLQAKAMVILSGYPSNLYKEKLEKNGWAYKETDLLCTAAGRVRASDLSNEDGVVGKTMRTEAIWMNLKLVQNLTSLPGGQITLDSFCNGDVNGGDENKVRLL